VSCPTATFCVAVDNQGGISQWHGSSWSRTTPDRAGALTAISCPTATFCVVVDRDGGVLLGRPA
jgi:hypothetical protein